VEGRGGSDVQRLNSKHPPLRISGYATESFHRSTTRQQLNGVLSLVGLQHVLIREAKVEQHWQTTTYIDRIFCTKGGFAFLKVLFRYFLLFLIPCSSRKIKLLVRRFLSTHEIISYRMVKMAYAPKQYNSIL